MSTLDSTCETCARWQHHYPKHWIRGNLGECADMVVFLRDGPEHVWTTPDHSCPAWVRREKADLDAPGAAPKFEGRYK